MADTKISALTASTVPLAGTEVLPIVQGGSTVKVSVANLTAGRTVGATNVLLDAGGTLYGANTSGSFYSAITPYDGTGSMAFVTGYSGGSMTFTTGGSTSAVLANTGDYTLSKGNLVIGTSGKGIDFSATSGAGTSELLADYEEGDYTPTVTAAAGTITSYSLASAKYTKIGRLVFATVQLTITNAGTGVGALLITVPFTSSGAAAGSATETAVIGDGGRTRIANADNTMYCVFYNNTSMIVNNYVITASITYSV